LSVKINKFQIFIGCGFVLLFFLSLGLYLFSEDNVRRVLFFPKQNSKKLVSEVRYLPRMETEEEDIQLLVEEIILGPSRENHEILLPKGVNVESVMLRDGVLYLDLSEAIVLNEIKLRLGFEGSIKVLSNTVMFNFRDIKKVFIFINGEIPKGKTFLKGITFNSSLLQ